MVTLEAYRDTVTNSISVDTILQLELYAPKTRRKDPSMIFQQLPSSRSVYPAGETVRYQWRCSTGWLRIWSRFQKSYGRRYGGPTPMEIERQSAWPGAHDHDLPRRTDRRRYPGSALPALRKPLYHVGRARDHDLSKMKVEVVVRSIDAGK